MNLSPSSRSFRSLALVAAVCAAVPSFAQSSSTSASAPAEGPAPSPAIHSGTFGMSGSLFGGGSGSVGFLYFLGNTSALKLEFGTTLGIAPAGFNFDLGIGYRMFLAKAEQVSLFVEPGARVGFNTTNELSLTVGAGLGLEYFLTDRLSIGAVAALSLITSNRFANVSIQTSTSSLFIHFYF